LKISLFHGNFNTQSLLHKMNDDDENVNTTQQLIDAIEKNDTVTASSLISSASMNLNGKSLPLHHAAERGRVEIMTMLLDAGADINAADKDRYSACYFAIFYDEFDALKLLVERGANLDVVDFNGDSLLSIVAQCGKSERIAIFMLDAGAPLDGLSTAVLMELVKSVAVFNRLMARGVDFDFTMMRDEYGASLCHYLASNVACEDDLRFLVNVCGNDAVHAVDNDGKTLLHWASLSGNELTMRVFVELGAEIDRQDNRGRSALIDAAVNVQPSCIELLLAIGADVAVVRDNGETAGHIAARWEQNVVGLTLSALVVGGGDLEQLSNNGETPRMIATRKNVALPAADEIDAARQRIAKSRLDLVRERAFQICVGLHSLDINALQLCEILMHSFGAIGSVIAFHQWWMIATKVKHFRDHRQQSSTTTTTRATNNETKTQ
jgi:ankyrin repeat protein